MDNQQPYLAGLIEVGSIKRGDFARLHMPHTVPDKYRLLWMMVIKDWKPEPAEAGRFGFPTLRDSIRHLKDEGIRFTQKTTKRNSPYSGSSTTEQYSFIPDLKNIRQAFGLLINAGFIEHPPRHFREKQEVSEVA